MLSNILARDPPFYVKNPDDGEEIPLRAEYREQLRRLLQDNLFSVGEWHSLGHDQLCQLTNNILHKTGSGRAVGEQDETINSRMIGLSASLNKQRCVYICVQFLVFLNAVTRFFFYALPPALFQLCTLRSNRRREVQVSQ